MSFAWFHCGKKLRVKLKACTLQWKCVQSLLHCFEFASSGIGRGRGRGRERAEAAVRMNLIEGKAHMRLDMPQRSSALLPPINLLREQNTVFGTFALSLALCLSVSLSVCSALTLSLSLSSCAFVKTIETHSDSPAVVCVSGRMLLLLMLHMVVYRRTLSTGGSIWNWSEER